MAQGLVKARCLFRLSDESVAAGAAWIDARRVNYAHLLCVDRPFVGSFRRTDVTSVRVVALCMVAPLAVVSLGVLGHCHHEIYIFIITARARFGRFGRYGPIVHQPSGRL